MPHGERDGLTNPDPVRRAGEADGPDPVRRAEKKTVVTAAESADILPLRFFIIFISDFCDQNVNK